MEWAGRTARRGANVIPKEPEDKKQRNYALHIQL